MKYSDIIKKASFDNKGRELKVYNNDNFGVGTQLMYLDEKEDRYYPLHVKGVYEIVERDCRIKTDKKGFIFEISRANKPIKVKQEVEPIETKLKKAKSIYGNSQYYKLHI